LVRQIRHCISQSNINLNGKHIKGHQDKDTPFHKLPYEAKGNVLADKVASDLLRDTSTPPSDETEQNLWTLTVQKQPIGGNIHRQIKHTIYKPLMTQRWKTLLKIKETDAQNCDWELFYDAITSQTSRIRYFYTKYNARLLPVGTNLKRRRHSTNDTCPCCGQIENHEHLLCCPHIDMETTYNEATDDIMTFMDNASTQASKLAVHTLLRSFRQTSPNCEVDSQNNVLLSSQYMLGSKAFFAGLWDKVWLQTQTKFHQERKWKKSALRWLIALTHKIQQVPFLMWQTRNSILHNQSNNFSSQAQHVELNGIIEKIFSRKPHQRTMAHCDACYFTKYDKDKLKQMKLQRKTNWIAGANLILTKYERSTTTQSARFKSYFQWDKG
jgi:hypothetical protein